MSGKGIVQRDATQIRRLLLGDLVNYARHLHSALKLFYR